MAELDEDAILARFDGLVARGIVLYREDQQTFIRAHNGLAFEFRLTPSLLGKPSVGEETSHQDKGNTLQRKILQPGSDIDISEFEVQTVENTHILAFNKFCVDRPHLLLLTRNGFRRQYERLDIDDLTAARHVITSLTIREYILIYNCGVDGGCSRLHKHMQVFPKPDTTYQLWMDEPSGPTEARIPFRYYIRRFPRGLPPADSLLRTYEALLHEAEADLVLPDAQRLPAGRAVPHNMVLTKRWMTVIPRRKSGVGEAGANAAGMLGMIWVRNEVELNRWLALGPSNVLGEVGVPA